MSPETALFQFCDAAVQAAAPGSPLDGVPAHATRYEAIETPTAIRVGDATVDVAPAKGSWKEFNGELLLEIVSRVDGGDHVAARELVAGISLAIAAAIQSDPSLGGRVCDSRILKGSRGWARVRTTPFAVQIFRILIDPRGPRRDH